MRRGRIFIFLAFILILGLVAFLVVWQRIIIPSQEQRALEEATPTPPPVKVIVVSQNIPKGYVLTDDVLTTIQWQTGAVPPGMFRGGEKDNVIGRRVKYDIEANTPLLETMLLRAGEQIPQTGSPWALSIPRGMVAVSIPISKLSAVSYAPRPGDHVNVIVTLSFVDVDTDFQTILPNLTGLVTASGPPNPETETRDPLTAAVAPNVQGRTEIDPVLGQAIFIQPSEAQRPRIVSQMLLQDVIVLQVGRFRLAAEDRVGATPAAGGGQQQQQQQQQQGEGQPQPTPIPIPDNITLVVRPQDAVALNYLLFAQPQQAAQLSLALRGVDDDTRETTLPVTLQFLLEQYQIPVPARLPYSLHPRIDALSRAKIEVPAPSPAE